MPGEVAGAVFVPRQIGVDPGRFGDEDRVAPRAGGILGVDKEVSLAELAHVGGDEPEPAVVMAEGAGVDTGRGSAVAEPELGSIDQNVADLSPGDQIPTMKDGRTGKVLETRRRKVVVLADPTDRRIGMKP